LLLGVATITAALIWPAVTHSLEVWSTDEELSFGFLVVPTAVGLVWWRRQAVRCCMGPGMMAGLPIFLVGLAIYLMARRVGINALAGIAISPLLLGIVIYLWGWAAGRVLAFPIGFLVFGFGLYRGLFDTVGFAMQRLTAVGAASGAQILGVPVIRDGLILRTDSFAFIVADTCSGMNSLVSLLALAAVWTYVARGSVPARLAVILSVLPIVVLANTMRVTLVLLVASWFSQDTATGFFHGASSLVLFGLSLGGLLLVGRIAGCRAPSIAA